MKRSFSFVQLPYTTRGILVDVVMSERKKKYGKQGWKLVKVFTLKSSHFLIHNKRISLFFFFFCSNKIRTFFKHDGWKTFVSWKIISISHFFFSSLNEGNYFSTLLCSFSNQPFHPCTVKERENLPHAT